MYRSQTAPKPAHHLNLSLEQASTNAREYWAEHHLLSDLAATSVDERVDELMTAASRLGLTRLTEVHDQSEELLIHLTGRPCLTQSSNSEMHRAHRCRNTLAALTAGCIQHLGGDPTELLAALPSVAPRSGNKERPLHDDEILLLRHRAVYGSFLSGRHHVAASQYALTEAGAWPSETTAVRPCDFDDPRNPTVVTLPGVENFAAARAVVLPTWARPVLQRALDRHLARRFQHADQWHFAYTGMHPASSPAAGASASGNLARAMRKAGMPLSGRPEPLGIVRWRVATTARTEGLAAAIAVRGKQSLDALMTFADLTLPPPNASAERRASFLGY